MGRGVERLDPGQGATVGVVAGHGQSQAGGQVAHGGVGVVALGEELGRRPAEGGRPPLWVEPSVTTTCTPSTAPTAVAVAASVTDGAPAASAVRSASGWSTTAAAQSESAVGTRVSSTSAPTRTTIAPGKPLRWRHRRRTKGDRGSGGGGPEAPGPTTRTCSPASSTVNPSATA